jgi:O-acetylhomoserine (thiol)-lyase
VSTPKRALPLRNMGAALSPMAAFQILQGIETLALQSHAKMGWVNCETGLPPTPTAALRAGVSSKKPPLIRGFF